MNVVLSLASHPSREIIALGCENSSIKIWNIVKHEFVGILSHEGGGAVVQVVFSGCGNYLAAASSRTSSESVFTISLWTIDFGSSDSETSGYAGNSDVVFRFLCSDTQLSTRLPTLSTKVGPDASVSVVPSGDIGKPRSDVNTLLHQEDITTIAFQPPLMDREAQFQLQSRLQRQAALEQRKKIKEIQKAGKAVTDLLLRRPPDPADVSSSDEEDDEPLRLGGVCRALASGSKDQTVRFWNFAWALEKAEKKRILDEAKLKRKARLLKKKIEEKQDPNEPPKQKEGGGYTPEKLAFRKRLKTTRLEDEQRERFIWRKHKAPITSLGFSDDAQFMLTASLDGVVVVWKVSADELEDDEEDELDPAEIEKEKREKNQEKKNALPNIQKLAGKKGEKQEKLLQKAKTVGNKSFYEPAFTFPCIDTVFAISVFPHFTLKGQVREYYVAMGCERSVLLYRLHQITHSPRGSNIPALLDSITSDDKLRHRHLRHSWAWEKNVALNEERKTQEEEEARQEKKKKKRRKYKAKEENETKEESKKKQGLLPTFLETRRLLKSLKLTGVPPRQKTGLVFDTTPNYVQLTLVRREAVSSPVTCIGTTYLFHRDFVTNPTKDTSTEMKKKDTISTSVQLHGLDESRSLLIVTGHKNKELVAWILDYELAEEPLLRKLAEGEQKEGKTEEKKTPRDRASILLAPPPIFSQKPKINYEENLRPIKAVIGSAEAPLTSLKLGNVLMNQWLAESSVLSAPSSGTTHVVELEVTGGRKGKKTTPLGEVERFRKQLEKRILYRYYVFVASADSKVGMYTMNVKIKRNPKCLYLYRFRPKPSLPLHVDYIWKNETRKVTLPLEHKHQLSRPEEGEKQLFSSLGVIPQDSDLERKQSTEYEMESDFITLKSLKSESDKDVLHKPKSELSKLHHFQQLAAPDYQTSSNSPLSLDQDMDPAGYLSSYNKEVRGGSSSRMCTVDTCSIT